MSDTHHHGYRWWRWDSPTRLRGLSSMPNAPAAFRRLLVRRYRRIADREVERFGEVRTPAKKNANWLWW